MSLRSRIEKREQKIRAWEGNDASRKRTSYFACYTIAFLIVSFVALFVYPSNGRSLVWSVDGLEQYYPFFVYQGQWLRSIFDGLISGQGLQIPLWSYDLGYGSDIVSTLDTFFDPLNLLSGLCPEQYSEYLFQFLVVFRLYLAGLAFSLFAFRFRMGRFPVLVGALLYSLCGTAMAVSFWPAGAWPLVLFPLLLLGVEKVLAGERPYVFILSVTAFFVISYYFSYMACLLLVAYCAVRVVQTQKGIRVVRFLLWALRFLALLLVGVLMACVVLVPSLIGLFGLERFTDAVVDVPLFYTFQYYASVVSGFVSTAGVGSDCYIGFGGVAFLACVLLFSKGKQYRVLKIGFIVMTAMLLLPAFGSLFNGLNYATNRWVWAYALIVCFIVAKMLPNLLSADKRDVKRLAIATLVFCVLVFLVTPARTEKTVAAVVVMLAALFLLSQPGLSARARKAGIVCCVAASVVVNAFYFVSPDEGGVGANSSPLASLYTKLTTDAPNHLVSDLGDEGLWRYDDDPSAGVRTRNDSLVLGLKGIDFYNSSYNSYVDDFHTEMGINKTNINFSYKDLGGRSILESLAGVKYYLVPEGAGIKSAYNYDDPNNVVASGLVRNAPYLVYEGSNVLPLAYTYDSFIPRDTYKSYTPAQRQESMLQGVVLDDSTLPETAVELESDTVPYQVSAMQGLSVEDGVIRVTDRNASLTLTFSGQKDAETYFYVKGLDYTPLSPLQETGGEAYGKMSWYQKAYLHKQNAEWAAPNNYGITLSSDKGAGSRRIENSVKTWHMYGGKSEWLVNMGYSTEAQTSITLHFDLKGEYRFKDLAVVCQPMKNVNERIDALKADPIENLEFGTNRITASVDVNKKKAMLLSVPYSKGWSAFVDGKPVDIKRANTAFMAIELEPGQHEVELRYMTPGLPQGAVLSGIGLAAFVAIACYCRIRQRAEKGKREKAGDVQASEKKGAR